MAAAYLTGGQGEEAAGDTSHSISIDSGATGSDRLIEITLVGRVDPCTLSSVQYGGVAMTSVADVGPYLKSYRLVAPANGANNLTFTSSAFDRFQYAFKVLTGVDQTTPLGTPVTVTSTATGDRSTGSVTCPAGGMVIGSLRDVYSPTNPATAASGGGTLIGYHRNGNDTITAHSYRSDTGALAWTTDNLGFDWAAIGIPVNASSSATVDQEGARFVNDDGSESGSSFKAAQNVNVTMAPAASARIRFLLQAAGDPAAATYQLEYRKVGDTAWTKVST